MNGYQEAEKIDKQIGSLVNKEPISSDNVMEWWHFVRTIQSGLAILEEEVKTALNLKTEEVARAKSGGDGDYS